MGFKTKWNRFWTLRNTEGGFTLVELVVVIAILAILAGVAVPAYTGYIKRAREAGDQLLIAAVNEAFVSSCLEAGVEMIEVTDAKISVSEQLVFGVSSVTTTTEAELNVICSTFNQLFEGNFNTAFVTENVKSLDWVPEEASFKMDHENSVETRVMLSNGKVFTVDPDTMAQIQDSAYADMGYTQVAKVIDNLTASSTTLVGTAQSLGLGSRFSAVLLANGLVSSTAEADALEAGKMANGLQMVTAKHLANPNTDLNELATMEIGTAIDLGKLGKYDLGTYGVLKNLASGDGGTATVSALATQYALVQAFAQTDEGKTLKLSGSAPVCTGTNKLGIPNYEYISYDCSSVEEFLNSPAAKADPVWALKTIQAEGAYTTYTKTEDYTNDLNGFAATMSLLGDNLGTVTDPGAVDINDYFNSGVHSQDAADALTQILGQ